MGWAEKLPSGKYRALYRDRKGTRRSAGSFDHKRAAEKAADVAEDAARRVGWRDPSRAEQSWGSWCEAWWPTRDVEPGTLARDKSRRDRYLMPAWADVPLVDITRQEIRAWVAHLRTYGLAPASVARCLHLFSASLTAAVDAELLTVNPAYKILVAQAEVSAHRYLTTDEFGALLAEMPTEFDAALIALLAGTGLRWGEAIGIHIPRLDVPRANLRVAETWDDRLHRVKPYPKGRRIRDVPVPDWTLDRITPLIRDRKTGMLFERHDVLPGHSNWSSRVWLPAVRRAQLGKVRVHDLRHTYASWLIQSGLSLPEVGRLLGHISPLTTQQYAHLADVPRAHVLRALPDPSRGAAVGHADVPALPQPVALVQQRRTASPPRH